MSFQNTTAIGSEIGRAEAVQRCFEHSADALHRYFAVRVGDTHLVDDLMQQLWLRSRLAAEELRGAKAEPWLWRIAQNLLREARRRRGRELPTAAVADPALALRLAEQFDTVELPDEVLERRETRAQLLLALSALPADAQELLIAFYFEGHSQMELARRGGVSERAIEGRMYRARLALRERLAHLDA